MNIPKTPTYDVSEGISIFARTHFALARHTFDRAEDEAAHALLEAVSAAALAAGFTRSDPGSGSYLKHPTIAPPAGHLGIKISLIKDSNRGIRLALHQQEKELTVAKQPNLTFDVAKARFVPIEQPDRSAVAVVAECIEQAIPAPK